MKLKHYLICTHLMVLAIPIFSIGILSSVSKNYNTRTEMKDYLAAKVELAKYETVVGRPELYMDPEALEDLTLLDESKSVDVILYDAEGRTIYSTTSGPKQMLTRDELYRDLNEIQHGYRGDVIKRPVFESDKIVGFYQLAISRKRMLQAVKRNIKWSFSLFICINIMIFIWVIYEINKRFNKPLIGVINSMNDYAKGNSTVHIKYKSTDEIGLLCQHFNEMKDEIEEGKQIVQEEQRAKEYMSATISHDLKTPLTAIRAYAEMMKLGEVTEKAEVEEYIDTILNKCDYMRDMLDDLLTYNMLSLEYEPNLVEVEGDEFCEMLFEGISGLCEAKHITLHQEIDVDGDYLVDAKYMPRVVDNIVSNGIRHTANNRSIWMGAFSSNKPLPSWVGAACRHYMKQQTEPGLWLIIQNEGMQITQEECVNLFKPFYQSDEARSKKEHKGVGLGLSISKMIIEKHGGDITMLPVEGVGNSVLCYIKAI